MRPEHHVSLTRQLKGNLQVGHLSRYNGRTCCQAEERSNSEVLLFTDSAASRGFGVNFRQSVVCRGLARNLGGSGLVPQFNTIGAVPDRSGG